MRSDVPQRFFFLVSVWLLFPLVARISLLSSPVVVSFRSLSSDYSTLAYHPLLRVTAIIRKYFSLTVALLQESENHHRRGVVPSLCRQQYPKPIIAKSTVGFGFQVKCGDGKVKRAMEMSCAPSVVL